MLRLIDRSVIKWWRYKERPTMKDSPATSDEKLDFKKIMPIFVIVLIDLLGLTVITQEAY